MSSMTRESSQLKVFDESKDADSSSLFDLSSSVHRKIIRIKSVTVTGRKGLYRTSINMVAGPTATFHIFLALVSLSAVVCQNKIYNISMFGCNDDNIHQIPGYPDYFVGRIPISVDSDGRRLPPPGNFGCQTAGAWGLGLLKMEWTSPSFTMSFVKLLLWPNALDGRFPKTPIQNGKYVLNSAYDATIILHEEEYWLSFECAGQGFATSSCAGPLTPGPIESASIDLARTSIVVLGTYHVAASVPKIFPFNNELYMFFDWFLLGPGYLQQMGVRVRTDGPDRRMWAVGHSDSMPCNDNAAICVWRPSPRNDMLANAITDVFMVVPGGATAQFLFALGAVGGAGCSAPRMAPSGCYRAAVSRSNFALGEHSFEELALDSTGTILPGNPMEYFKQMTINGGPDAGNDILYGQFLDERSRPGVLFPSGFRGFPRPGNASFWTGAPSPCPPSRPAPDWGDRAGVCVRSCGALGAGIAGVVSFDTTCVRNGMRDLGCAYDVPHCCAPITCGDAAHPAPNWGLRGGLCLPSCGGLGGTASFTDPCSEHDLIDAGSAYDAPYCCMAPFPVRHSMPGS